MVPLGVHAWQLLCGEISVDEVVDMREPERFERGHLEGAICLTYNRFQDESLDLLGEDSLILVVDPGGARAAEMATWLRRMGRRACFLEGGMSAWTGSLERGPSRKTPGDSR